MALYNFIKRRVPGPGTGDLAFLPSFGLQLDWFTGRGRETQQQLAVLSTTPQVYYQQQQTIDGFEGIEAGTMSSAPLIELDNYLSGLAAQGGLT